MRLIQISLTQNCSDSADRLTLCEFVADDWPAVLAYQSDPRYLRCYAWTGRTPAAVQEFIGWFLADQQAAPRLCRQLAVTLTATGELIGNCHTLSRLV